MSLETGALLALGIGMLGSIALTAFAVWSKRQEDREKENAGRIILLR